MTLLFPEEALELVETQKPDIVLMDLRMPRLGGVEATHALHERHPDLPVVVLTTYADDSVVAALSAGAAGYLTKDADREDIRPALEAAAAGQAVLDASVQAALLEVARQGVVARPATLPDGLTDREAEVLALIASGLSNHEIAERLYVAEATVKRHVNRIFAETGSRDRAQAAVYAHRHRLDTSAGPEGDGRG